MNGGKMLMIVEKSGSRNLIADAVRGLAIILVMTGHAISNNGTGYEEIILYKIIWSLQMPLFMIISGYVTKYSKAIIDKNTYSKYIKNKCISYLLPWFVWTIIVRGILLKSGEASSGLISYIRYIMWHMDTGYWFFFSLWTICIAFGTASFVANKCTRIKNKQIILTVLFTSILAGILVMIGLIADFEFLGIKYSLYYLPFFLSGYLYGCISGELVQQKWIENIKQAAFLPAITIFVYIIINYNTYLAPDTPIYILIRILASLAGCVVVFLVVSDVMVRFSGNLKKLLVLVGQHSLELYVIHYFCHPIVHTVFKSQLLSVDGMTIFLMNFVLMVFFAVIISYVLSANKWSRLILFGKK